MLLFDWRIIFVMILGIGLIALVWFSIRMKETLDMTNRRKFTLGQISKAIWSVLRTPRALNYTIGAGFISGAFMGFLNSFQQIFEDLYGLTEEFPLYFALLASAVGLAGFLNSKLVGKYGMGKMVQVAIVLFTLTSVVAWSIMCFMDTGVMALWWMMVYLMATFFFVGILFSNLNSLAMEPLGKVAGTGASIVGAFSTLIGAVIGTITGLRYDQTLFPVMEGVLLWGGLSILVIYYTEYRHKMD